jgi:hypothetical protein
MAGMGAVGVLLQRYNVAAEGANAVRLQQEKSIVFEIIDKMLTNKKFKDFFNNNLAAL